MRLFKDTINKTDEAALARKLIDAMEAGEDALKKLLLGTGEPDAYAVHGSYREGGHARCGGLASEAFTEKRLCKCLYYRNSEHPKACDKCDFQDRYDIVGGYRITDHEVPAFYYEKGIGKIDLIISDGGKDYAAEVKPYKGNDETLLRMIAEIMTYTLGYPEGKYERAMAFFEDTPQEKEYQTLMPEIKTLLQKARVTVFCFKKEGNGAYRICKF